MKRIMLCFAALLLVVTVGLLLYLHGKQPVREGAQALHGLRQPVSVRYDERGVPHIQAGSETDLYRALGYVQAQDRLFQMEMLRRLARGELAEVLGRRLLPTDTLFRTLRIRQRADSQAAAVDPASLEAQAIQAYLEGINQYQQSHARPLEFDLLGIPTRPFTPADIFSVIGYMAYSFAAAFRTEPLLTYIRDTLGEDYLRPFVSTWQPGGALATLPLTANDWRGMAALAKWSEDAVSNAGLPQFEGSNGWVIAGSRTASGKPLLAGDPHIRFAAPSVWYEAHLSAPGFELYGDYQSLVPFALLGHNQAFAWTLTMFQNDDIDLVAETTDSAHPGQVLYHGEWVALEEETQSIAVKGEAAVELRLRRSPHGPIVNDVLGQNAGTRPIALWWTYLEAPNPIVEAFYRLNRADTLDKARSAVAGIQAPGLNVLYANAGGDIAWWAAAALPRRPDNVDPAFILDGASTQADKAGYYPFTENPHEENPKRGYVLSANTQPPSPSGRVIPGYYNLPNRGQRLDRMLAQGGAWSTGNSESLQLDDRTDYAARVLETLLPTLRQQISDTRQQQWLELLAHWQGNYPRDSLEATLFNQLFYELARATLHDELGDTLFDNLLGSRVLDTAMPKLVADERSPWWDDRDTPAKESRADIVLKAWKATIDHLRSALGDDPRQWQWGKVHRLTQMHPLGTQPVLGVLYNVGPFEVGGSHEVPNNFSAPPGPAPWSVSYGPSIRRIIDMGAPADALGSLPLGQSGVLFDRHYKDQARPFVEGRYQTMHLSESDVAGHTESRLELHPAD
ncbi:penicillin acylase family protein [Pseudomonas sp. BAV 2493]|uniref:penicillin acylase family protein n=1 Tax=unclassified Pseudomonas TaxID=196821 RepID=UPI00355625F2